MVILDMKSKKMPNQGAHRRWNDPAREQLKRRVASMYSRRVEMVEIVQALTQPMQTNPNNPFGPPIPNPNCIINPKTNKPYSRVTIYRIRKELLDEWRRQDAEALSEMFGEIIGSNKEVERAAWTRGELDLVLRALEQRASLTGVNRPRRVDVTLRQVDMRRLPVEALERLADGEDPEKVLREFADTGPGDA